MAMTTPLPQDDATEPVGGTAELDQAIDSLRGVLKADAAGDHAAEPGETADAELSGQRGDAPARRHGATEGLGANLDLIMDIPVTVEVVLGRSRMQVAGLMGLEQGATIPLDRKIGEPVEIVVNGRAIARGEIAVLENDDTRFGVKLTEVFGGAGRKSRTAATAPKPG